VIPPTLDDYLAQVARFVGSDYGKVVRQQFQDYEGNSELALLVAPTPDELVELRRAVAIMTAREKACAATLSDEQVQCIAEDAQADAANLAIFFNGYAIMCKRVSCLPVKGTEIKDT
jgi:hypothetical protein